MLTFYERFGQIIAHILSVVISVIVVVSLRQLIRAVVVLLLSGSLNPLDHAISHAVFGMVRTLLIAMEFKHSITRVMLRRDHIVQVKTVILVAMLAIARKFIILDPATDSGRIPALAAALLALGSVYLLMRQRDDPVDAASAERAVHECRPPYGRCEDSLHGVLQNAQRDTGTPRAGRAHECSGVFCLSGRTALRQFRAPTPRTNRSAPVTIA